MTRPILLRPLFSVILLTGAEAAFSQGLPAVSSPTAVALSTPTAVTVSTPMAVALSTPAPAAVSSRPVVAVDVVWPREGFKYGFLKRSFTFGGVTPGSSVTVNGASIPVRDSGAFIAMVDLGTGTFRLTYTATFGSASSTVVRSLSMDVPYGSGPRDFDALRVLEPSTTVEVRMGDLVQVRVLGPPGREGTFSIKHLDSDLPLVWKEGLYEGFYRIGPRDKGKDLKVNVELRGKNVSKLKGEAQGKVTVLSPNSYRVVVTSATSTVMKSIVGGYTFFLPPGIPLTVIGRIGPLLHIELSDHEDGWVDSDRVSWLPEGTPPPAGSVGKNISASPGRESTRVSIQVERKLPFEVRQTLDPLSFEVRFYGGIHRVDRMNFSPDDPIVKDISWRQESLRVAVFRVSTRLKTGWGYDGYYEGNRFILEIRRPPLLPSDKSVFPGRRIAIDPGHGPEPSAIGPLGTTERDVNLALALKLKALLEAEGASVYMIRTSSNGPPLADRPSLAAKNKADLYVSVHANALPESADPYEVPRGFMTFFYHPQSHALAEAMRLSYRRRFPDLPDEGTRWGDLHVCRGTQMPAILVESAYVMLPEQEAMLRDQQERFARALFEGIKDFYEDYRKLQTALPDEKRATW